jgi:hypothetical protein
LEEISRLKRAKHSFARLVSGTEKAGLYEVETRRWDQVAEPSKLEMLKDLVNWEGVSNRDMAHILLRELDVGRLSTEQRGLLIHTADPSPCQPERPYVRDGAQPQSQPRGMELER